jgi:hypothetical protein
LFSIYAINSYAGNVVKEDSLTFLLEKEKEAEKKLAILLELTTLTRKYDLKKSLLFVRTGEHLS